jgi:hypothetical protein
MTTQGATRIPLLRHAKIALYSLFFAEFACLAWSSAVPPVSPLTTPGHFANFKEAIDKGTGGEGTVIMVQPGEHRWDNFLEVGQQVDIRGSAGAVLPGTLWMKRGSRGNIGDLEMVKESGSCIIFEGGQWNIDSCRMCCSRWAVLWSRCESEVSIKNSFLGGVEEGPGYCVNCQDHARVSVEGCHLERRCVTFEISTRRFENAKFCLRALANSLAYMFLTMSLDFLVYSRACTFAPMRYVYFSSGTATVVVVAHTTVLHLLRGPSSCFKQVLMKKPSSQST